MGQQTEMERERGEKEEKKERKKDVLMTCFEFLKRAATWNYYIYLSIYLFLAQFELDFAMQTNMSWLKYMPGITDKYPCWILKITYTK